MTFNYGMMVEYRHTRGWVNFIDDQYITICFLDIPDKTKHNGRYQANLVVFREYWNEVRSCVDEGKEKQEVETTSYFLQSRGCDLVGAAC
jgi:hypothetical protein